MKSEKNEITCEEGWRSEESEERNILSEKRET